MIISESLKQVIVNYLELEKFIGALKRYEHVCDNKEGYYKVLSFLEISYNKARYHKGPIVIELNDEIKCAYSLWYIDVLRNITEKDIEKCFKRLV